MEAKDLTSFDFYGYKFFECPKHGDEAPILVKKGNRLFYTGLYDAPLDKAEAKEEREFALKNEAAFQIKNHAVFEIKGDSLHLVRF